MLLLLRRYCRSSTFLSTTAKQQQPRAPSLPWWLSWQQQQQAMQSSTSLLLSTKQSTQRQWMTMASSTTKQMIPGSTSSPGYQSIGSFHSDNVEYLMEQSDDEYIPPSLPFATSSTSSSSLRLSCGEFSTADSRSGSSGCSSTGVSLTSSHDHRYRHDFLLDHSVWTFLNHGAFGAALRVGYDRAQAWRLYLEQQPLRYFDRDLLPHLVYTTRRLATFLKAPPVIHNSYHYHHENDNQIPPTTNEQDGTNSSSLLFRNGLTLLPNVTTGLCTVLRNHAQRYPQANILLWDTTYGSVKKMARTFYHPHDRIVEIPFLNHEYLSQFQAATHRSMAEQVFIQALLETLHSKTSSSSSSSSQSSTTGTTITNGSGGGLWPPHSLFILDQTTSNTAFNMPLIQLAKTMKEYDPTTIVCVDGAHGMLAHDVNLEQLVVDYRCSIESNHHHHPYNNDNGREDDPIYASRIDTTPKDNHNHLTTMSRWSSSSSTFAVTPRANTNSTIPLVDIYLSNGHKWLSCPRGVAILYTSSTQIRDGLLRVPSIVSHGIDDGYLSRFLWDGCRDYAAALSVPVVLDYWAQQEQHHTSTISQRLHQGLLDGLHCLIETWYPDSTTVVPSDQWHQHNLTLAPIWLCGPMALVRLPWNRTTLSSSASSFSFTSTHAKQVQDYLHYQNIEVPIKCVNGQLYVRVSYHTYNTTDDFERLAKQLLQFPVHSLVD